MTLDVRLYVASKGADLCASTAFLTLVDKMGYDDRLLGLKRFDYFHLEIETETAPETAIDALQRVLDRQSTFYNRNKHLYILECRWPGGAREAGVARAEVQRRWVADLANDLHKRRDRDFGGKERTRALMLGSDREFRVEILVEDDDRSARDSIAARMGRELGGSREGVPAKVSCPHRGTLWWLALRAPDSGAAADTARTIAVTARRNEGLLSNPNYQSAELISAETIQRVAG